MAGMTVGDIAARLEATVEGDATVLITGVAPLSNATAGELSFVHSESFLSHMEGCQASALIMRNDLETTFRPLIRVENPYLAFAQAMALFHTPTGLPEPGIHHTAMIDSHAQLGARITIGPGVTVGPNSEIGDDCVIWPGVTIGTGCRIGAGCFLYPNVSLDDGVQIGAGCLIGAGSRIGDSVLAMGGASQPPIVIEDQVELGANCCIAPGLEQPTRIGAGTKVDNQLTLGRGAQMGRDCLIVAQVVIGDGTVLGNRVTVAGQATVQAGLTIGDRVMVAAMSLVTQSISSGAVYSGNPARPHDFTQRLKGLLNRTPKFSERVAALEQTDTGASPR